MARASLKSMLSCLSPVRWTGPIFGKELRVASRRRWPYILRAAYLGALGLFVVIFWLTAVPHSGPAGAVSSRMGGAGKRLVAVIAWVQFVGTQVIALIGASAAISEEVRNGTLATLLTTPITSFQIVTGKLLSKLLYLVMLVILSVPLLALLRVFGGVPWSFVLASTCITLSSALLVGAIAMMWSAVFRPSYAIIASIAATVGVYAGLLVVNYVLMVILGLMSFFFDFTRIVPPAFALLSVAENLHPVLAMHATTKARMWSAWLTYLWIPQCGVIPGGPAPDPIVGRDGQGCLRGHRRRRRMRESGGPDPGGNRWRLPRTSARPFLGGWRRLRRGDAQGVLQYGVLLGRRAAVRLAGGAVVAAGRAGRAPPLNGFGAGLREVVVV